MPEITFKIVWLLVVGIMIASLAFKISKAQNTGVISGLDWLGRSKYNREDDPGGFKIAKSIHTIFAGLLLFMFIAGLLGMDNN